MFIGDENYVGKGIDRVMLVKFLLDIALPLTLTTKNICILSPNPKNINVIRVY